MAELVEMRLSVGVRYGNGAYDFVVCLLTSFTNTVSRHGGHGVFWLITVCYSTHDQFSRKIRASKIGPSSRVNDDSKLSVRELNIRVVGPCAGFIGPS